VRRQWHLGTSLLVVLRAPRESLAAECARETYTALEGCTSNLLKSAARIGVVNQETKKAPN
jgi:hypothetical protein